LLYLYVIFCDINFFQIMSEGDRLIFIQERTKFSTRVPGTYKFYFFSFEFESPVVYRLFCIQNSLYTDFSVYRLFSIQTVLYNSL